MTLQGIVEKISSLIWTRRYWSCGEFKLLVPFTEEHARLLVRENIIIKRGGNEAAEIRYIHITKNSQGMEEIEVQGKFLLSWIGKRILTTQIITKDTTQNILYAILPTQHYWLVGFQYYYTIAYRYKKTSYQF